MNSVNSFHLAKFLGIFLVSVTFMDFTFGTLDGRTLGFQSALTQRMLDSVGSGEMKREKKKDLTFEDLAAKRQSLLEKLGPDSGGEEPQVENKEPEPIYVVKPGNQITAAQLVNIPAWLWQYLLPNNPNNSTHNAAVGDRIEKINPENPNAGPELNPENPNP